MLDAGVATNSLNWLAAVSCTRMSRSWRLDQDGREARAGPGSCHGVNAGAAVPHQVVRIGRPPSGLPHIRLGGRGAASLYGLVGRGMIARSGAMDG
jgi:hypothetical protein